MIECHFNPYRELNANISDKEFEIFCKNTLEAYAKNEGLRDFSIKHDQHISTYDGNYQIDILAEYTALGVKNKVLVECKKYNRPIERKIVAELEEKLRSLGAHKGIVMSTSGFQSGAVQFAEAHGIALLQIVNRSIKHMCNSANFFSEYQLFSMISDQFLPKYYVLKWDCAHDFPYDEIYPTSEMYESARNAIKNYIKQYMSEHGLQTP